MKAVCSLDTSNIKTKVSKLSGTVPQSYREAVRCKMHPGTLEDLKEKVSERGMNIKRYYVRVVPPLKVAYQELDPTAGSVIHQATGILKTSS
jgi:hypothetical protein